jgi:hypothetical protein
MTRQEQEALWAKLDAHLAAPRPVDLVAAMRSARRLLALLGAPRD